MPPVLVAIFFKPEAALPVLIIMVIGWFVADEHHPAAAHGRSRGPPPGGRPGFGHDRRQDRRHPRRDLRHPDRGRDRRVLLLLPGPATVDSASVALRAAAASRSARAIRSGCRACRRRARTRKWSPTAPPVMAEHDAAPRPPSQRVNGPGSARSPRPDPTARARLVGGRRRLQRDPALWPGRQDLATLEQGGDDAHEGRLAHIGARGRVALSRPRTDIDREPAAGD